MKLGWGFNLRRGADGAGGCWIVLLLLLFLVLNPGSTPFYLSFPDLYKLEKHKGCLVSSQCTGNGQFSPWEWNWSRPPSSPTELHQSQDMLSRIHSINLSTVEDSWTWTLDASHHFSVKSMSSRLQKASMGPHHWIFPWNKLAPIKANVLGWRIEMNRIATADQLRGRNILIPISTCSICNLHEESAEHLFLRCPFADSLWSLLLLWCQLPQQKPQNTQELFDFHKSCTNNPRKQKLIHLIILAFCWVLWKIRNDRLFSNKFPSLRFAIKELKGISFLWLSNRSTSPSDITWSSWNSFTL